MHSEDTDGDTSSERRRLSGEGHPRREYSPANEVVVVVDVTDLAGSHYSLAHSGSLAPERLQKERERVEL